MFESIVVGTDGSGTAALALRRAAGIAKAAGARLTIVSAYAPPQVPAPPLTPTDTAPGVEIATGLLADAEKRYGGEAELRTVAREGAAADVLLDVAEEERADVIVVGSRGMTGAKRFVLGSVPNAVSHHAPCHVLIVHTTDEVAVAVDTFRKVLLTTDGSPTASAAVRVGAELARALGAETLLLHVGDPDEGKQVLEATAADLGGEVTTMTVEGTPADLILDVAEREATDLIVVGNRGMTGARRFLLGSVPNRVSHHAPCDVLVVKTT